jgi:hypothetical protein
MTLDDGKKLFSEQTPGQVPTPSNAEGSSPNSDQPQSRYVTVEEARRIAMETQRESQRVLQSKLDKERNNRTKYLETLKKSGVEITPQAEAEFMRMNPYEEAEAEARADTSPTFAPAAAQPKAREAEAADWKMETYEAMLTMSGTELAQNDPEYASTLGIEDKGKFRAAVAKAMKDKAARVAENNRGQAYARAPVLPAGGPHTNPIEGIVNATELIAMGLTRKK